MPRSATMGGMSPPEPDISLHEPLLAAALAGAATGTRGAVICLCAAWCRTCDDYRLAFDAEAARQTGLVFRWLDIEDEADALGDIDVETFPTLVIGSAAGGVQFAGPVLPQAGHLTTLLRSFGLD